MERERLQDDNLGDGVMYLRDGEERVPLWQRLFDPTDIGLVCVYGSVGGAGMYLAGDCIGDASTAVAGVLEMCAFGFGVVVDTIYKMPELVRRTDGNC